MRLLVTVYIWQLGHNTSTTKGMVLCGRLFSISLLSDNGETETVYVEGF
jgi:hypothetical protein